MALHENLFAEIDRAHAAGADRLQQLVFAAQYKSDAISRREFASPGRRSTSRRGSFARRGLWAVRGRFPSRSTPEANLSRRSSSSTALRRTRSRNSSQVTGADIEDPLGFRGYAARCESGTANLPLPRATAYPCCAGEFSAYTEIWYPIPPLARLIQAFFPSTRTQIIAIRIPNCEAFSRQLRRNRQV